MNSAFHDAMWIKMIGNWFRSWLYLNKLCFSTPHNDKSLLWKVIHYKNYMIQGEPESWSVKIFQVSLHVIELPAASILLPDWRKLIKILYRTLSTHILVESWKCDPALRQEENYFFCLLILWVFQMVSRNESSCFCMTGIKMKANSILRGKKKKVKVRYYHNWNLQLDMNKLCPGLVSYCSWQTWLHLKHFRKPCLYFLNFLKITKRH